MDYRSSTVHLLLLCLGPGHRGSNLSRETQTSLQLFLWDPKAFPSQPRDIVSFQWGMPGKGWHPGGIQNRCSSHLSWLLPMWMNSSSTLGAPWMIKLLNLYLRENHALETGLTCCWQCDPSSYSNHTEINRGPRTSHRLPWGTLPNTFSKSTKHMWTGWANSLEPSGIRSHLIHLQCLATGELQNYLNEFSFTSGGVLSFCFLYGKCVNGFEAN